MVEDLAILGVITPTVRVPSVAGRRRNRASVAVVARRARRSPTAARRVLGRRPGDPADQPRVHRRRDRRRCSTGCGRRTLADGGAALAGRRARAGRHRGGRRHQRDRRRAQGRRADARGHGGDGPRRTPTGSTPGRGDRWLACLPLHHVASLGALARSYVTGVPCTVHDTLRPRPRRAVAARRRHDDRVARADRRCAGCSTPARRCTSSACVIAGGAPCPPALRARAEARRRRTSSTRTGSRRRGAASRSTASRSRAPTCGSAADDEILVRGRDGDARLPARSRAHRARCSTPTVVPHRRRRRVRRRRPAAGGRPAEGPRDHRRRQRQPDRGRGRARAPSRRRTTCA